MNKRPAFDEILSDVARHQATGLALRQYAMDLLGTLPTYDWCGVYLVEGEELVLDAFVGAETNHTRIPIGKGVCGTAVATGNNQVVSDVRSLENYLACSIETRSEIVVLIRRNDTVVAQVDIDSHEIGAFDESDEKFLVELGSVLVERWD